jgi:hypothetical protein
MPMVAGDLVVLTLRGTAYSQRVMTSYGFRVMNSTDTGDTRVAQDELCQRISTDTGTNLLGTFLACVSPGVTIEEIWAQRIRPQRMRKSVLTVSIPGTLGTGPGTPNVSAVVTRKSDLGYRSSISNLHLPVPPIIAMYNNNGVWTGAYRTLLDAHAFESYDSITVVGANGSVTYKGAIINAPLSVPDHQIITAHSINPNVRVMRRRTVGLGE